MERWIERQKHFIEFTLSSLSRRKGKNFALIFVYTLVVFVVASVIFFTHSIKKEASIILKDAPEMVLQRRVAGRHDLIPLSYSEKIREIRGVGSVRGRLWGYYYDPVVGANYTLIVSQDGEEAPLSTGTIAIGQGISRTRLASEGDTLEFKACDGNIFELEVKRILSSESELISSDLILITEEDFRRLFGTPSGFATDITVQVRNPREIDCRTFPGCEADPEGGNLEDLRYRL
jgi:lipoprotein-releasing system permease protein